MGIRKTYIQASGFYFITFTNYNWLPLFEVAKAYDLVYHWFDYLKREGHQLVGYVIMPNHIHLMLAYKESHKSINTLLGNAKRYMAYEIIKRLKEANETELLRTLESPLHNKDCDSAKTKRYQVFRDSFHILHCYSQKFILQKLQYMHNNPCAKKWMLANSPLDYLHSSALFYFEGKQARYPVVSWQTLGVNGSKNA